MTPTKPELEAANAALAEENEVLLVKQEDLETRIARMEAMVAAQQENGTYEGPKPEVFYDPFDFGVNPHLVKEHPEGKILGWVNPIYRASYGMRGWTVVCYDDEIGQALNKYLVDPPAKMVGSAQQDNYVRRGTDLILAWLPEDIWKARQQKNEAKALQKQAAAGAQVNTTIRPGVSTFGDGVQVEERPPGGFKVRQDAPPLSGHNPAHRTEMFADTEE